jgi:CBS domain-containing protein
LTALVDDDNKLVGVFTGGDAFTKVACTVEDITQHKIKDYMTSDVTTLKADAPIAYALQAMSLHRSRHIPVVDDEGRPEGVVSFRSVIHYLETNFPANGKR